MTQIIQNDAICEFVWGEIKLSMATSSTCEKTSQRHSFWPYPFEINKMGDKALSLLSPSCYLDEEACHITNEFSFEEKDPFQ